MNSLSPSSKTKRGNESTRAWVAGLLFREEGVHRTLQFVFATCPTRPRAKESEQEDTARHDVFTRQLCDS